MSDYGPQYCDVRDPEARRKHKAVSCPDKILTAFCQLGALKLKSRRCLIFFFDVNHAYIMAEATQSLSLESDTAHEPGDEIWMGHSVIPRDVACCETTVNLLPSFPITAAADSDIRKSAFVVNDLTKHPELCERPYVTGYPNGRFYAGVPITTPDGVNIGAYCILDDKVRDGLEENDLIFLRDMSQTVMAHLETVRALSERQQNYRMVTGLGDFLRGAPDAGRQTTPVTKVPKDDSDAGAQEDRDIEHRFPYRSETLIDIPVLSSQPVDGSYDAQHQREASAGPHQLPPSIDTFGGRLHKSSSHRRHEDVSTGNGSSMRDSPPENLAIYPSPGPQEGPSDRNGTYQRAAETLVHSLDVDGVVFLDASVREFGGLGEAHDTDSNDALASSSDGSGADFPAVSRRKASKTSQTLGCAESLRNTMLMEESQTNQGLTGPFLRKLMRRHPHGKVWTFDGDLKTHSEDGLPSDDALVDSTSITARRGSTRKVRRSDATTLQAAFPGCRSVALYGIWDYTNKRWTVAGLYWTFDPLRHIAKDREMTFFATFCDIIVAETKRLEVVETDKAKSDFISNVSHELRSPLHGILGSCELLSDHRLDNTAQSLLGQINSCGRTLLEIIEHLLDFAYLRNQRAKGSVKRRSIGHKSPVTVHPAPRKSQILRDASIPLDEVTEDAIVSSVYSFQFSQNTSKQSHPPVILDIDRSKDCDWHCNLAAGGWKRICINLVTNALKYTSSGFIEVSLKQEHRLRSDQGVDAIFTVADTGKGMSKEFQQHGLFNDFAQEDSLSDGLGIGMHMVSRIVRTMGGKIEVVSDQDGSGTRVTIRVPLDDLKEQHGRGEPDDKARVAAAPTSFEGLRVGLFTRPHDTTTLHGPTATAVSAMAIASIENNLNFLGIQFERCDQQSMCTNDLIIVMKADFADHFAATRTPIIADNIGPAQIGERSVSVLVICDNTLNAQQLRRSWDGYNHQSPLNMECIALPCGLKAITQAISSAIGPRGSKIDPIPGSMQGHRERGGSPRRNSASNSQRPLAPRSGHNTNDTCQPQSISVFTASREEDQCSRHIDGAALTLRSTRPVPSEILPNRTSVQRVTSPIGDPPTLLLVDDNGINLKLLAAFARKHEYPHITASDGQQAIEAFEKAHQDPDAGDIPKVGIAHIRLPAIILMDINMPVMDGYEATQRIRAYEKKQNLTPAKIIAVTALQSEAAQIEAFGSGFDMFLSKPLKLKDLAKLIETCLS